MRNLPHYLGSRIGNSASNISKDKVLYPKQDIIPRSMLKYL